MGREQNKVSFSKLESIKQWFGSIRNNITRTANKSWASAYGRFGIISGSILIATAILFVIGLKTFSTEYPKPQIVNESQQVDLYVKLDNFSLSDRTLQMDARYWTNSDLRAKISEYGQNWELRAWISKPIKEAPIHPGTQNSVQGGTSAGITISATPYFGTPVPLTVNDQSSVIVSGTMTGEPSRFPFDVYKASIGTQNDSNVNKVIQADLPIRFNIENHLKDYQLATESGGFHTSIITLQRTWVSKWIIPFVPLLILLLYSASVLYLIIGRKASNAAPLISYVALFISILSLRTLVVPNGVPFGCVFDLALIIPFAITIGGVILFIRVEIRGNP